MAKIIDLEAVAKTYSPTPLDLSDVTLPESLTELTESIAENTHEIWSQGRRKEGWTYGPERDETRKKHPDLLPYCYLTDSEKEYDRATAMNAIKLIVKLGYKIEKA
ncbi:MAG: Ryanodine receptor Ryr [Bacteroidales bacterium]|nr:Ryanodine receptor Ryr [Bacteroidales bacterium]